jgi:hypothetical protein
MARGYSEPVGNEYGADDNSRDRWRESDRERSNWRERDDNRGFFERAGDEVRSWFSDDDDRDGDLRGSRSSWDRDREFSRSGTPRSTSWDRNLDRSSFPEPSKSRSFGREDRGSYGRPGGSFSRERDRFGSSDRGFGGLRDESDLRGQQRKHPQSWGEANRGQSNWDRDRERNQGDSHLGYRDFGGTLGGFGNQTFASSEHDHYRNWRDREMAKLDSDYDDYCREREQQFNQDFDSWRRNRPSQSQFGSSSNADVGTSSNAGVGTTTASVTGTAGSGSAIGSATGSGGSIQSDTTGSTETADAGTGRSSSRSRS